MGQAIDILGLGCCGELGLHSTPDGGSVKGITRDFPLNTAPVTV